MADEAGRLGPVPLEARVELGRARLSAAELRRLGPGSVVELESLAGDPVELVVNGRLAARGEVVVVDGALALRITEVVEIPASPPKGP